MSDPGDRHLRGTSFASYLRTALPIEHPIAGTPRLVLFIDPDRTRIGLRGPAAADEVPSPTGLENLTVRLVYREQQRMIEVAVTDPRVFVDSYPLLCAVADRVQLQKQPITSAVTQTVRRLGHLLRPGQKLPQHVETGLTGELCVVIGLARTVGCDAALQAWHGMASEEHDFTCAGNDLEVKTTTSDRRVHWISSLTQLVPSPGRPLWLVSLQVTDAGTDGTTLAELIARARAVFDAGGGDLDGLDDRLRAAGWRDSYAERPMRRWHLRSRPAVFAVASDLPRLTPDMLGSAVIDTARISEVRYRLDLDGYPTDPFPDFVSGALVLGQEELR
jgi:hypothetical protein